MLVRLRNKETGTIAVNPKCPSYLALARTSRHSLIVRNIQDLNPARVVNTSPV
jgi:hypothetical protein